MKLKEVSKLFHEELDSVYGKEEVKSFFFILIDAHFGLSRLDLAMNPDFQLMDISKLKSALNLLKDQVPIQYIMGETEFYGLNFKVNQDVLIPRPETEELVEWIVNDASKLKNDITILDIGTGSGCIAVSLAKQIPKAKVYALDVSNGALNTAKVNSDINKVDLNFVQADILKWNENKMFEDWGGKFDIIVSNPPYVRNLEKEFMHANVLDNEPHLALFVEDEAPLVFYDAITQFAVKNLKKSGCLYFEINEYLGSNMVELLNDSNFKNIELKQDMFKKDRMVKGQFNND